MDSTCLTCHGRMPQASDRYLCGGCQYQLRMWLREIARSLPILQDLLRPETGPAQRGGSGRAHAPLPLNVDILSYIGPGHSVPLVDPHGDQTAGIPISATLYAWARYLATEYPAIYRDQHGQARIGPCDGAQTHARTGGSITSWCAWLTAYLPYAVTRPWCDSLYEQVQDVVDRIRRITHTEPRVEVKDAPCPGCYAYALVEKEDEWHIRCLMCAVRLTPVQYIEHRAQVMPELARAELARLIAAARQPAA